MNLNRNMVAKNQIPNDLLNTLRTLFDRLDAKYGSSAGFIKYADVEQDSQFYCQKRLKINNDGGTVEWMLLPTNFLACLKRIMPANNMVTFERMYAGLRLALAEDKAACQLSLPIQTENNTLKVTNGQFIRGFRDDAALKQNGANSAKGTILNGIMQHQHNGFIAARDKNWSSTGSSPSPCSSNVSVTYKPLNKIDANGLPGRCPDFDLNAKKNQVTNGCSIYQSCSQSPSSSSVASIGNKRPPPYDRAISLSRLNLDLSDMLSCDVRRNANGFEPIPRTAFATTRLPSNFGKSNERLVDDGRMPNGLLSSKSNAVSSGINRVADEYAVVLRKKSHTINNLVQQKRHTVTEGSHSSVSKHNRLLQDEKDLLTKSADICNRLVTWYNDRLKTIEMRRKLVEKTTLLPLDFAVNEERFNLLRIHITELNRRMASLMESTEKGFPSHMNNESQRIMSQPIDDQYSYLKRQNASLTDEVTEKSQKIVAVEKEKEELIKQLYNCRLNSSNNFDNYVNMQGKVAVATNGHDKTMRQSRDKNFNATGQGALATLM